MGKLDLIKESAKRLKLSYLADSAEEIVQSAEEKSASYQEMLLSILEGELDLREKKSNERRLKDAGFPVVKTLEEFDTDFQRSIT